MTASKHARTSSSPLWRGIGDRGKSSALPPSHIYCWPPAATRVPCGFPRHSYGSSEEGWLSSWISLSVGPEGNRDWDLPLSRSRRTRMEWIRPPPSLPQCRDEKPPRGEQAEWEPQRVNIYFARQPKPPTGKFENILLQVSPRRYIPLPPPTAVPTSWTKKDIW